MRLEGLIAELNSIADFSGLQAGLADAEGNVLYAPGAAPAYPEPGTKLPAAGFVTLLLPPRDGRALSLFARGTDDAAGDAAVLQALKLVAGRLAERSEHAQNVPELLAAVLEKRPGAGVKKLETLLGAPETGAVYRLLAARSDADKEDREQAETVGAIAAEIFREERECPVCVCCVDGEYSAAVLCRFGPDAADNGAAALQYALEIADTVNAEAMIPVHVGVSSSFAALKELPSAFAQAISALTTGADFELERNCFEYDKLGLERLVSEIPQETGIAYVRETFGSRLGSERASEELLRTVKVFLDCNMNASEAAKAMYIHRNTMTYRLEKFQKLTGLDCASFGDGLRVRIALLILQRLGSRSD
ncbi:MAG: helix-turn-helix domain-containing protein [Clostridia bacterium]|nr:helix-turn-helix domain-containing protein [Clostridia bacterium]